MAYAQGRCMTHGEVLFPDDLENAHDRMMAEYELDEDERERLAHEADVKKRSDKYCFTYDGLTIIFPTSAQSIISEGKRLSHCVGGYAERHLDGVCSILFLRQVDKPQRPYVTIEMSGNQLRQIHGYKNERESGSVSPKVTHAKFLKVWLKWLEQGSKRDKEGNPIIPKMKREKATEVA